MTTLTCPRCNWRVTSHNGKNGKHVHFGPNTALDFECPLSEAQATRLAQRRKAAERLAEWLPETKDDPSGRMFDHIDTYLCALRDTCILGDGESESDLLKELEGETK